MGLVVVCFWISRITFLIIHHNCGKQNIHGRSTTYVLDIQRNMKRDRKGKEKIRKPRYITIPMDTKYKDRMQEKRSMMWIEIKHWNKKIRKDLVIEPGTRESRTIQRAKERS